MSEVPGSKLRLHLLAEKAMGLSSLPVGKKSKQTGSPKPIAPAVTRPIATRPPTAPSTRPAAPAPARPVAAKAEVQLPMPGVAEVAFSGAAGLPFDAPLLKTEEKRVRLQQMDDGEVKGCTFCELCKTRTHTVFGEGDVDAKLMFIGEGPGENEDLTGRPFVGRAGELLDKQISAMGLKRSQVFIANVVKCRPPNNRQPLPDETAACTPYLMRQIEIIRPKVIVTLGLPATQFMLSSKLAMGKLRGRWHEWRGIGIMPTYHPAYVLRSYTPEVRGMVWSDLQMAMDRLGLKVPKKPAM